MFRINDIVKLKNPTIIDNNEYLVVEVDSKGKPIRVVNLIYLSYYLKEKDDTTIWSANVSNMAVNQWEFIRTSNYITSTLEIPYSKVINKIRQMESRRKELGYEF